MSERIVKIQDEGAKMLAQTALCLVKKSKFSSQPDRNDFCGFGSELKAIRMPIMLRNREQGRVEFSLDESWKMVSFKPWKNFWEFKKH